MHQHETIIEDLYRLQQETVQAHSAQLAEARQETDALSDRIREMETLVHTKDSYETVNK